MMKNTIVIPSIVSGTSNSGGGTTSAVNSVNGKSGDVVITKDDINLGNVDNTSDLEKPISTAAQQEFNTIVAEIESTHTDIETITNDLEDVGNIVNQNSNTISTHIANVENPHSVTKAQVGLSNVDNTSDLEKPISTSTQSALDLKQDKLTAGNNITISENNTISFVPPSYLKADLPVASEHFGEFAIITDSENMLVWSNGTTWREVVLLEITQ